MDTSIKIYVDRIMDFEERGTYGFEFDILRIMKDIFIIFNNRDATDLIKAAMANEDGISYMHRFCQFIVYFHLRNDTQSGSLALFDCRNDMDTALDMHLNLTKHGFDPIIKEDFMNQFLEIREIYTEVRDMAILTIEKL